MFQKSLHLLLILALTSLIYLGNTTLINISLFLLITLTIINKNYYSFLSIIPLFFIKQNSIIIFVIFWLSLLFVTTKIKKKTYRNYSVLLISFVFLLFETIIFDTNFEIAIYKNRISI